MPTDDRDEDPEPDPALVAERAGRFLRFHGGPPESWGRGFIPRSGSASFPLSSVRPPIEQRFRRPSVMGVVNVTPDSFFDGGANFAPADAVATALGMMEHGAAIVDVGGESTRPGSEDVGGGGAAPRDPRARGPGRRGARLDRHGQSGCGLAGACPRRGDGQRRDGTASDPRMAEVVADQGAYLCLMHMQGEPRTVQVIRPTTTSSPTSRASSRSGSLCDRSGRARGADLPRSRHRLR